VFEASLLGEFFAALTACLCPLPADFFAARSKRDVVLTSSTRGSVSSSAAVAAAGSASIPAITIKVTGARLIARIAAPPM
jgi:hypothetical protein